MSMTPGRFTAQGISAYNLIQTAYDLHPGQLAGLPKWANSDTFDIVAKEEGPLPAKRQTSPEQSRAFVRALLADRFQLKAHVERREVSGYELKIAPKGLKLEKETAEEQSRPKTRAPKGGVYSMGVLAMTLSHMLDAIVVDRTMLEGNYYVKLRWTGDNGAPRSIGVLSSEMPDEADDRSIFEALKEDLGLSLEGHNRVPLNVLVIDQVSKPSEN
jgi:uncharacterized protein (TIGR03435 family)